METTVEYVFDTIQGIFYDQVSNVGAITGKNESTYPALDSTDPIPAYQRGIYFTGQGSYLALPYYSPTLLLFSLEFSISSWINPSFSSGTLFYKTSGSTLIFSATLANLYLDCSVIVNNQYYFFSTIYILTENSWNNLIISISTESFTSISVYLNNLYYFTSLDTEAPFKDSPGQMYVGSTSSFTNYYQGFIYSIEIYSSSASSDLIVSTACDGCSICPLSGICYSLCNITSYLSDSQCAQCATNCTYGCRHSENCKLCYDDNCISCSKYDETGCYECKENYEVQNYRCVECSNTEFYNADTKTCDQCGGLCLSCVAEDSCVTCMDNSSLDSNQACVCDEGYSGNITCDRNVFTAFLSVNSANFITLKFTEFLSRNLTSADLVITLGTYARQYELRYLYEASYLIIIDFTANVNQGDLFTVKFNSQYTSSSNSVLNVTFLSIGLYARIYINPEAAINQMKQNSKTGVAAGISVAIFTSVLKANPINFFHFVNNAEIYYYVILYDGDLDPELVAFISELRVISNIPNIYSYAIDETQGVQISGDIKNYWNDTNLIFLNSGVNLTILSTFLITVLLLYGMKITGNNWLKVIAQKGLEYFKYGAFTRLWIQSYMELCMSCLLGVVYVQFDSITQIFNFVFSFALLVRLT